MKKVMFIALAAMCLSTPVMAKSISILIKKTDGVRVETVVTPGPELPDTVIPAVSGVAKDYPNNVSDHCMTTVMFVSPGDLPGTKYPAINVDDNCNPLPLATTFQGGSPEVIIDNGFGPDVITNTDVPTCTRKYKVISTTKPYISTTETTTDGAC